MTPTQITSNTQIVCVCVWGGDHNASHFYVKQVSDIQKPPPLALISMIIQLHNSCYSVCFDLFKLSVNLNCTSVMYFVCVALYNSTQVTKVLYKRTGSLNAACILLVNKWWFTCKFLTSLGCFWQISIFSCSNQIKTTDKNHKYEHKNNKWESCLDSSC